MRRGSDESSAFPSVSQIRRVLEGLLYRSARVIVADPISELLIPEMLIERVICHERAVCNTLGTCKVSPEHNLCTLLLTTVLKIG